MRLLWISSVEITTQYHCKGNQNRHNNQHENAVLDGKFYTPMSNFAKCDPNQPMKMKMVTVRLIL